MAAYAEDMTVLKEVSVALAGNFKCNSLRCQFVTARILNVFHL